MERSFFNMCDFLLRISSFLSSSSLESSCFSTLSNPRRSMVHAKRSPGLPWSRNRRIAFSMTSRASSLEVNTLWSAFPWEICLPQRPPMQILNPYSPSVMESKRQCPTQRPQFLQISLSICMTPSTSFGAPLGQASATEHFLHPLQRDASQVGIL